VPHAGHAGVADRLLPWLDRLPVSWRLVLRNPWRHPGRTASTMLGVVLALLLILVSAGMIDTVRALIDRQFSTVDRSDATVVLDATAGAAALDTLTAVDGVAVAEPLGQVGVTLVADGHRYTTNLQGFATDTAMHRFADADGPIVLPADGALLGAAARDELDVTAGGVVTVLDADGRTLGDVTVRGFVDEPLGTPAYVSLATFRDLAGQSAVRTAALRYDDGTSAPAVTRRVEQVPGVLAAVRTGALEDLAAQFLGLFYAFVGAMLVCGGLLAFGILFTTMSANLGERTTEVAMLRAAGVRRQRLAGLITAENLLITLVGVVPGIALGWLAAREALAAYTSDLWRFDLTMSPWTVLAAAGGIVLAALLSQVPGLRALRRVDIAQTGRRRAT
jgi:putative ABC transport system permease protein